MAEAGKATAGNGAVNAAEIRAQIGQLNIETGNETINLMIPGVKSGKGTYKDKNYEDELLGKGRMVGDLSDVDWDQWVEKKLLLKTRMREWDGIGRNKIKRIGIHRQHKIRRCSECGELLRV